MIRSRLGHSSLLMLNSPEAADQIRLIYATEIEKHYNQVLLHSDYSFRLLPIRVIKGDEKYGELDGGGGGDSE